MTPTVLGDLANKHQGEFYEMFSNILAGLYRFIYMLIEIPNTYFTYVSQ